MFNFLKSTEDLEREFRDWSALERARVSNQTLGVTKEKTSKESLRWLMESVAGSIAVQSQGDRFQAALGGGSSIEQRILSQHYYEGAQRLDAVLKRRGWTLATDETQILNAQIVVVDAKTRKRVPE